MVEKRNVNNVQEILCAIQSKNSRYEGRHTYYTTRYVMRDSGFEVLKREEDLQAVAEWNESLQIGGRYEEFRVVVSFDPSTGKSGSCQATYS